MADLRRSGISFDQSAGIGITKPDPVIFEVSSGRGADNGIVSIVRHKGRITTWNSERGFGFVTPADGGERVFVHVTAIADRTRPPAEGDMVTYDLTVDERKRPRAARVRKSSPIRRNSQTASASTSGAVPLIVISLFVLIVVAGTLAGRLPPVIIVIYGVVSIVTFLLYWLDKSAARRGDWRTQERSLLLIGLVGGWPGAVVAQRILRHKIRKQSFQLVFWGTAVMNSIGLGWLFTDSGSSLARRLLE
jgi:uncharacterized membrane protein YsdA (DUF1294 family)/cold shock CspA family protein